MTFGKINARHPQINIHLDHPNLTMPDLDTLPEGSWPENAIRNNGPDNLALERYKLRELAEGWPMYRYPRPPR